MNKIDVIYLKELNNIDEIIDKKSKVISKLYLFSKKILGGITIKENGIAILPYKNLKYFKHIKIYFIKKVLKKINLKVVLSKKLNDINDLKYELIKSNIKLIQGNKIHSYLNIPIVEYICKIRKKDIFKQEIMVLVKNNSRDIENQISELARTIKRINIITPNFIQFRRLESKLNEVEGIPCQITNNKRKSLLKAEIIINYDFDEQTINMYSINRKAIIISTNTNIEIKSKLFSGIIVQDFQITYENNFTGIEYNKFDKKLLYESTIINKDNNQISNQIKGDNVKIVNLIGKRGIINVSEFK